MNLAKLFLLMVVGNAFSLFASPPIVKYAKSQGYSKKSSLSENAVTTLLLDFYAQANIKKIEFEYRGIKVVSSAPSHETCLTFALVPNKKQFFGLDVGVKENSNFLYVNKNDKNKNGWFGSPIYNPEEMLKIKKSAYEVIIEYLKKHL